MPRTCDFGPCERTDIKGRGLCGAHYAQIMRTGVLTPLRPKGGTKEHLLSRRQVQPDTGCWLWTGGETAGYGLIGTKQRERLVHRIAYTLWNGAIPAGETVHHKCGLRLCFNPDHLQLATHRENLAEMFARSALEARIAELEAQVAELRCALGLRRLREVV